MMLLDVGVRCIFGLHNPNQQSEEVVSTQLNQSYEEKAAKGFIAQIVSTVEGYAAPSYCYCEAKNGWEVSAHKRSPAGLPACDFQRDWRWESRNGGCTSIDKCDIPTGRLEKWLFVNSISSSHTSAFLIPITPT
jgi:hypothetical protein